MSTKRDAIMQAALLLFAQRGYDGVGLREIASEAGVAQPTINYHFESKEILYDEVLRYLTNEHHDLWRGSMEAAAPDSACQLAAIVVRQTSSSRFVTKNGQVTSK